MPSPFHNVEFPSDYARGAVGGPEFRTTIVETGSGYEQRNIDWDSARCRWDLSRLLTDPATRDDTLAFFRARKGRGYAFLFKDWNDHYVGMAWTGGGGSGSTLQHTGAHDFAEGDGVTTVFQLYKVYTNGGATESRKITRPVSPIKVYLDDVEAVSGFTVDYSIGKVTFSPAPANGVVIGWSGEFRVPVRCDTDILQLEYLTPTSGNVALSIVEVRE